MAGENNYKQAIQTAKADIGLLIGEVKKLETAVLESSKIIRESLSTTFKGTSATQLNKTLQSTKKSLDSMTQSVKAQDAAMTKKIQTEKFMFNQLVKSSKLNKQHTAEKEASLAVSKKVGASLDKETDSYAKLLRQQRAAKKVLQDEIAKRTQNTKAIKVAQVEYDRLSMKINQAAAATARSTSLMTVAVARLKSLAVAFGFFGTLFLVASTIKDAIQRVRDFDKEMQNMAGVLRTTRGELASLEAKIKDVASQSIMTSNDVAKLATSLLVLGKSKADVEALLKPANDLGIALNTTSEAAGEFLVQSLNSFGAGTESAAKYADIIATVRTSTSLDFQKMVDSFQYLSPISRVLGEDLAYTGAVIGILADNGLKAQQAGRLLGTAQQKLAKEGRSLSEALDLINQAAKDGKSGQEQLAIASGLFGAQAGKVGVILANNSDIIQKNAAEIRANGGALDDLVKQKMEAFDAKIKILDSSWEKWILSLKAGQGVMGKLFVGAIEGLSTFFNALSDANTPLEEFVMLGKAAGKEQMMKTLREDVDSFGVSLKIAAETRLPSIVRGLQAYQSELSELLILQKRMPGDSMLDLRIKKLTEMVAKHKEMANVARESMGLMRQFDDVGVRKFNAKKIDDVNTSLKYMKIELELINQEANKGVLSEELRKQKTIIEGNIDALNRYKSALQTSTEENNPFVFLQKDDDGEYIKNVKDKIYWENELKKAKLAWDETAPDDNAGRAIADANIKLAEKQLEIWDRKNKTVKESKKIMQGSIDQLTELKSKWEDERDRLETTSEGYKELDASINGVIARIEHLKIGLEALGEIETFGYKDEVDTGNEQLKNYIAAENEKSAIFQAIKERDFTFLAELEDEEWKNKKDMDAEEIAALEDKQQRRREIVAAAIDYEKELYRSLGNASIELGEAVLEARVEKVQEEIDANKEKYAVMLDDENLSEEQRSALEAERDRKEVELEAKKKKRENEAFLFSQAIALAEVAIATARGVTEATALAPATAGASLSWIPLIIGTGLVQAATIVAQSIPAFEKGTDNAPEGVAMVDEKRPEVHTDKKGNVKSWGSSGGANLRYLEAGDKIYKSHDDFFRSHNDEDINRAVFNMNMSSQGAEISKHQTDNALRNEMRAMRASNDMVWKEVKKLANRPINNNVTVNVPDNSAY